ncbi:MAG: hypothetical protein QNJ98_14570 [Planctomycetota bacterium]|nr:hypothetical protein [Planctomycetota bacterium]
MRTLQLTVVLTALALWTIGVAACGGSSGGDVAQQRVDTLGTIAFQETIGNDRSIWVMDGSGLNRRLVTAPGEDPCLTALGVRLAYRLGIDIYTIRSDGTDAFPVKTVPPLAAGVGYWAPAINAAGTEVAYVVKVVAPMTVPYIRLIDADGTNDRDLVQGDEPAFSADGQRLVFMQGGDICVINRDGTGFANLTGGAVGVGRRHPQFSPDGETIAYTSTVVHPWASEAIVLMEVATGVTRTLAFGSYPAFSADGEWIAFVRTGAIYRMRVDGTQLFMVSPGPGCSHPSWQ